MFTAMGHRGNRRTPPNRGLLRYRSRARIVAIVDLILSSMSLCLTIILVLGAVIFSSSPIDWDAAMASASMDEDDIKVAVLEKEQLKKIVAIFIWVVVVFSGITIIIEIVAAVKLLNATQLGKEPDGALKLCIFWRRVCVAFTVLLIVGDIFFFRFHKDATPLLSVIQVVLRLVAIYVVSQYIKELEIAAAPGGAILPVHCTNGDGGLITGVNYGYIPNSNNGNLQQPAYNPDFTGAPPSYDEVMKEPPLKIASGEEQALPHPYQPNNVESAPVATPPNSGP